MRTSKATDRMQWYEACYEAERQAKEIYGGEEQVKYKDGKRINRNIKGCTIPDIVRKHNGKMEAIEVKCLSYPGGDVYTTGSAAEGQIRSRINNLPKGFNQRLCVMLWYNDRERYGTLSQEDKEWIKEYLEERIKRINKNYIVDLYELDGDYQITSDKMLDAIAEGRYYTHDFTHEEITQAAYEGARAIRCLEKIKKILEELDGQKESM